jgi:amino acid transporter
MSFDTGSEALWVGLLAGSALAFYALLGFEDSVNMAEECKRPAKAFPRALFLGLGLTGLVYMSVAFVSSMVVPTDVLAKSSGPLLEVVKTADVPFPPKLFALIALLAVSNTALINMLMASRLVYGMANEGIVPGKLGTVHGTRRSPWVAILLTTTLGVALVVTGDLAALADTTVLLLLLVFATVNVSVLVLRRERVEHDHFHAPTIAPVLGAVASLVLASPLTGRDADVYLRALVLLAIGVAFWAVNHLSGHGRGRDADLRDRDNAATTSS